MEPRKRGRAAAGCTLIAEGTSLGNSRDSARFGLGRLRGRGKGVRDWPEGNSRVAGTALKIHCHDGVQLLTASPTLNEALPVRAAVERGPFFNTVSLGDLRGKSGTPTPSSPPL